MEPFIRSDQYHFISHQAEILIRAYSSVNDIKVLNAQKAVCEEKSLTLFKNLTEEQKSYIKPIAEIKDRTEAEMFLVSLKPYVIPFEIITFQRIKKLFPKAKKLKAPPMEDMDLKELSYLSWTDIRANNKKYIIVNYKNKLTGITGTFDSLNQKGICALCGKYEEIGLFVAKVKGITKDISIKRGNYICQDSLNCNHNMTSLEKLNEFIERLQK